MLQHLHHTRMQVIIPSLHLAEVQTLQLYSWQKGWYSGCNQQVKGVVDFQKSFSFLLYIGATLNNLVLIYPNSVLSKFRIYNKCTWLPLCTNSKSHLPHQHIIESIFYNSNLHFSIPTFFPTPQNQHPNISNPELAIPNPSTSTLPLNPNPATSLPPLQWPVQLAASTPCYQSLIWSQLCMRQWGGILARGYWR